MDMLKNVTGAGSDKPKAEESKPGFVTSMKLAAEAAHSNIINQADNVKNTVTGAATNVVETARGFVKSGQEAVGNCLNKAGEFAKPAGSPAVDTPKAEPAAKE